MGIQLDFTKAEKQDEFKDTFTTTPEGWHDATITDCELRDTKAGDKQYLNFSLQIISTGQKFFHAAFVNGSDNNSVIYTMIKAIGSSVENSKINIDPKNFINKAMAVNVKHKKEVSSKDGKEYTNLKLMGVDLLHSHQSAQQVAETSDPFTTKEPVSTQVNKEVDGDDIPF